MRRLIKRSARELIEDGDLYVCKLFYTDEELRTMSPFKRGWVEGGVRFLVFYLIATVGCVLYSLIIGR
jgi:hypothetical protein